MRLVAEASDSDSDPGREIAKTVRHSVELLAKERMPEAPNVEQNRLGLRVALLTGCTGT